MPLQGIAETRVASGLTSQAAAARLSKFGRNDPTLGSRNSKVLDVLRLFLNPLVAILLIAAIASAVLGDMTDATIIIAIVLLSNTLEFVQTHRCRSAIEQLRAQVAPRATVLRDGQWQDVPSAEVVPDDVIQLSAGDLIPADARLLESHDLYVQQAALTGESMPVEKSALGTVSSTHPDAENMVFLGTSVVSGSATAIIVATGPSTAFGSIAARLGAPPEPTAFQHGLKDFSLFLTRTVLFLVLFLLLVGLLRHSDPLQSLLFAVALAVGLTPEFLPMIVSITLANGARAMVRQQVIVKHLAAIQNFGSIDILCTDKTGTLTSGHMSLDRCLDPEGAPSTRVLTLAKLNSKNQTGIRSPLDEALLASPQAEEELGWIKCDEIPYDFQRRRLSVVVEQRGTRLLITKGAPEQILELVVATERDGCRVPLTPETLERSRRTFEALSKEGLRTLAVAFVAVDDRASYSRTDERDLTLAGFVTFTDKPLPETTETLAALRSCGVEVKILTGDSDLVCAHVCAQVAFDSGKIVLGKEIDNMTDAALGVVAEQTAVFARTSPAQKNRILMALKHRGHVVGYLGDGINDAPSLHAADVGISVASAVDVAREAADIILLKPGLRVLSSGILEGRKASGNVMKYLLMSTSSNFGNMFSMAIAAALLPFLPMLPTQILLNNFLYDISQITIPSDHVDANAIRKPGLWDIALIRRFMLYIGPISSVFDLATFYVLLHYFSGGPEFFHTGWFVESLATQILVIYVIRTMGSPVKSAPSPALLVSTLLVVATGLLLPLTPLAAPLGLVHLPALFYLFVATAVLLYLASVQLAKDMLVRAIGH